MTGVADAESDRGRLAAISDALVRLHARHYGKGPSRARTFILDDVALSLLYDPFTTVEKTMLRHGNADAVRDNRLLFYRTLEGEFRSAIEDLGGRRTSALLPQISVEPPVVGLLFLLQPADAGGPTV